MTQHFCLWPQAQHEPAALAQQATEAITRLSKGFGQQLCTRQRPEVGELLLGTLETALRAPQARTPMRLTTETLIAVGIHVTYDTAGGLSQS